MALLGVGSSGAVDRASVTGNYRGQQASPSMDYESFRILGVVQVVFGNNNQTVLHTITLNSTGLAPGTIDIWKISASSSSSQVAGITHFPASATVGGIANTLVFDTSCPNGFIVNVRNNAVDLTVSYRETALGA